MAQPNLPAASAIPAEAPEPQKILAQGADGGEVTDALRMAVETLLNAMEAHCIVTDASDYGKFCADIGKLRETFAEPSSASLLAAAGTAKKVILEYNQQASRSVRARILELHKVLKSFAKAVAGMATGSDRTLTHLRDLERQIVKAGTCEQVRSLGTRLAECLETLRLETELQHEHHQETLSQLRREVESAWRPSVTAADAPANGDALSGLRLRAKAESALKELTQSGRHGFVVAFVVDRVQLTNARFGYAVGDQILVLLREHLATQLQARDQLFRWTGPVFLALLDRPNRPDEVRAEITRITSAKLETTAQIGTRPVLLPVAFTSAIFSLFEIDAVPLLIEQIDAFVAGHLRR